MERRGELIDDAPGRNRLVVGQYGTASPGPSGFCPM